MGGEGRCCERNEYKLFWTATARCHCRTYILLNTAQPSQSTSSRLRTRMHPSVRGALHYIELVLSYQLCTFVYPLAREPLG